MNLSILRKYASGKAPFLGVPVFSLAEGKYITAVFRREHLQAAASCPNIQKVTYDEREHVLVLNGGKRACWRLRNLNMVKDSLTLKPFAYRTALKEWSEAQRSHKPKQKLEPEQRRIQKLTDTIAKLERQQKKIYLRMPLHPFLRPQHECSNDYQRKQESQWRQEKHQRRVIGWIAHRPRKTWNQFYKDIASILGKETLDSKLRHERVCALKSGPDIIDYLKHLPKYLYMANKPWKSELDEDRFKNHRTAQLEYLRARRESDSLLSQIDMHKQEIQELQNKGKK